MVNSSGQWRSIFIALALYCYTALAFGFDGKGSTVLPDKRQAQDIVTWDEHSLFVRGERIFLYTGEFHPWRLPVPDLWVDVLQKIKALGYNGVSFYVDWAPLEGSPGHFSAEGVFAYEPFFAAAEEVGLYLIARPGPYINAEVSGGGFPGWLSRTSDILRTNQSGYLEATQHYVSNIGRIIADGQITKGGPVIAFQAENEYTFGMPWVEWPDVEYIDAVNQQFRDTGIVVPFINNEAAAIGLFTPGDPGGPDIYGHDNYPGGWNCSDPTNWTQSSLPTNFRQLHLEQSPNTPYSILEFQGGALDSWGGPGLDGCAALINSEFERVFFKNNFGNGISIFNVYMTYGGTNWGNIGQSGGYTSYDYGAAIKEDRTITREKYHEAKLIAQSLVSSPAYLTATPGNLTNSSYSRTSAITTTPLLGDTTNFYVVRHSNYTTQDSTPYTFTVDTSSGTVTIPQLGGTLALNGRDSKIHVTDYDVSGVNLIYSSAEVYTHTKSGGKRVLILYGLTGETHELAFSSKLGKPSVEGGSVKVKKVDSSYIVQWEVTAKRKVLHYGNKLDVYLLWRNEAFNYWALQLESPKPIGNYTSQSKDVVIAKAGYLLRTAVRSGNSLRFTGDLNSTAELEILTSTRGLRNVYFNNEKLHLTRSKYGRVSATLDYTPPSFDLPDLAALRWKSIDSLPEIHNGYDDSTWREAKNTETNNTMREEAGNVFQLKTPTSLIANDYGFHTGSLIFRGHFVANGNESSLYISTTGGLAFGHSVWINETYIGSWIGNTTARSYNQTLPLPVSLSLSTAEHYVITVVIDHMGMETNWSPGLDMMKTPRGIIDYALSGHSQSDITWKLTGNLNGENHIDQTRGPLNEGAFYAERQGYHLPAPPNKSWKRSSPLQGIDGSGITFYSANFELDMPDGYDIPLSFVFANSTERPQAFRAQLYVNGWQFGKYTAALVHHLGPQTKFPVPQGILNYEGANYIAVTLWAQETEGAKLEGLELVADVAIQSGFRKPRLSWDDVWSERPGAY
ncbi:hypothetical protein Q7P37_006478 [Cladosporium fusiforme]